MTAVKNIEILQLGIREAWNIYKFIQENDTNYNKIRYGETVKFDINDYLEGRTRIKPKSGIIIIRTKTYKLGDFDTEIEKRERLIKTYLEENMTEEEVMKPRGLK